MKRTVSDTEAREQLDELLDAVAKQGAEVAIERGGEPVAAIIPAERYEYLERSRERFWAFVERTQAANTDLSPEEVEQLVDEEVAAARAEHHGAARTR